MIHISTRVKGYRRLANWKKGEPVAPVTIAEGMLLCEWYMSVV